MLFAILLASIGFYAGYIGLDGLMSSKTLIEALYYQLYLVSAAILLGCGSICHLLDKIIDIMKIKEKNKE